MSDPSRHMVLGLQSSGKTTFAAALWYILANGGVATVLKQGQHRGDYSYLDRIAERWERGYKVPRTEHFEQQEVEVNLRDPISEREITLQFTDLPGEGFERAFGSRRLSDAIVKALGGVSGLLLFVSAAHGKDNASIIDVVKGLGAEQNQELDVDDEDPEDEVWSAAAEHGLDEEKISDLAADRDGEKLGEIMEIPFNPGQTPRDVQLVDIIDSLRDRPVKAKFPRIAVIISAWDRVVRATEPSKWLSVNMPLLDQYLKNSGLSVRIYGASAQGGEVPKDSKAEDELDRQNLLSISNAGERVKMVGYSADTHDLTHPIRWLSGLEAE